MIFCISEFSHFSDFIALGSNVFDYNLDVMHYLEGSLIVKLDNERSRILYFIAYDNQHHKKHCLTSSFARTAAGA